ncbi:fumarylacetoacetate hydrolase family protein [Aquibacillus sp. 3ASR75-11]|uniref:Fumarylacetoacetate hydrolase family protein n=1 Tax=Terrihalobacillus insolitus TaxID=2950438 RepID=A0A9X3WTN5_9BACI|nr:fumarylacetoacetate hydrolase family protein [Terrihalobacillus insolitus]MDC3415127.1 fumarylacetoacetate hydrolase family protein [Terrihalobacillus insolitus]MDC3424041.1 fumarylacetoacetate hydrolase family protein [Terrihalobacillus insolitus]
MGISIVRYSDKGNTKWGVVKGEQVYPIPGHYRTLATFLEEGVQEAKNTLSRSNNGIALSAIQLLSPVTSPAQVVCQGANYSAHRQEAGLQGERPPFNLIFTKAPSSISGPNDDILSPSHVNLLDYEIELGLVIKKEITEEVNVDKDNFHEYVAGFVIANDVSARDVQFTEGQWYKAKSYRSFCPVGPILYLIEPEDTSYLHNLELTLTVNGEVRQSASTQQLLYKPEESLKELSGFMSFYPGDLLLTGTPGGVALKLTSEDFDQLSNPVAKLDDKIARLNEGQRENGHYLTEGDVVRCEIKSLDGEINLGVQENKVKFYLKTKTQ